MRPHDSMRKHPISTIYVLVLIIYLSAGSAKRRRHQRFASDIRSSTAVKYRYGTFPNRDSIVNMALISSPSIYPVG